MKNVTTVSHFVVVNSNDRKNDRNDCKNDRNDLYYE